jgi:sugar lactone lactonase YvrE
VHSLAPDATIDVTIELPDSPSGLGFLPDGSLLIVSMYDRQLLRVHDGSVKTFADLRRFGGSNLNDMVTDGHGRSYIGLRMRSSPTDTSGQDALLMVAPDGTSVVAASEVTRPNGMVVTPDGNTLIVGETTACRLTSFTIHSDGTLGDRRLFADLGSATPDGICLDANGGVWIATLGGQQFLHVDATGSVTRSIDTPGSLAVAPMLGGKDRRTLYMLGLTMTMTLEDLHKSATSNQPPPRTEGWIASTKVETPGEGWP